MAVNVQAAVRAQLLGVNLTGMVSKTTATVAGQAQTTTEFLVMPSELDENEPITVEAVVNEINRTIYKVKNNVSEVPEGTKLEGVTADSVNTALSVVGLDKPSLSFMQTFVHYKKVTEGEKDVSKITEYAIGVHIKSELPEDAPNDFKFLQIKDVYINVWDTQNQRVLERMQIWTPEQLEQKG